MQPLCVLMYCFYRFAVQPRQHSGDRLHPRKRTFSKQHITPQRDPASRRKQLQLWAAKSPHQITWGQLIFFFTGRVKKNKLANRLFASVYVDALWDGEEFVLNNSVILTYYFVWQLTKASTLISTLWCTTVDEWFLFILLNFQEIVLSILLRSLSAFEISLQHYIIWSFFLQICTEEPASVSSSSPDICPPDIQISGRPPLILPYTPSFLCIKSQLLFCLCYWMRAEWDIISLSDLLIFIRVNWWHIFRNVQAMFLIVFVYSVIINCST